MAKPTCWGCGKQLMTKKGGGYIFKEYTDPLGNKHNLHKRCFNEGDYGRKPVTAQPVGEHWKARG